MIEVVSYSCSLVESPLPSSKTNVSCAAAFLCFFGFGMGVINAARRRDSMICCVGCPVSSSSQCRRWTCGRAYNREPSRRGATPGATERCADPSSEPIAVTRYDAALRWLAVVEPRLQSRPGSLVTEAGGLVDALFLSNWICSGEWE